MPIRAGILCLVEYLIGVGAGDDGAAHEIAVLAVGVSAAIFAGFVAGEFGDGGGGAIGGCGGDAERVWIVGCFVNLGGR